MSLHTRSTDSEPIAEGACAIDCDTGWRPLVLGFGNVLLGDDGAGIHVIERLRADGGLPPGVELLDGGTLNFSLLDRVESATALIVVDATDLGVAPGTVSCFADRDMDAFLASPAQRSVHDLNLGDLLRMCALRDALPERRFLVGIQPQSIDWSPEPKPAVAAGIEEACRRVRAVIEELMP